ncbi:MAG: phthalate 4,5-dioxygenase [Chloroflexi bacterium]|nr:phthalate 4,5-dioxygenase [Chloroflexota bacterium]
MSIIEENELMTRTDAGTPCGELMRRYWQPAALSEELPAGGAPLPVRLLGEDLVMFRDEQGRPGLLGLHCSHRGADLSYGRLEDGGLRCIYHGWLYDVNGRCLEQPGEPAGSTFHERIRHTAYPCIERARVIFAYMGPGEPPEFPNYEFLCRPLENGKVQKYYHECNYLQANEGNYDLSHLNFLHYLRGLDEIQNGVKFSDAPLRHQGMLPAVLASPVALTPYGVRSGKIRSGPDFEGEIMTTTEFVLPNFTAFANGRVIDARDQEGYTVNWHVPMDDTHHWKYTFDYSRRGPMERGPRTEMIDYRPVRNLSNRFLQDREEMANQTFAGLGRDFTIHDKWVTEGEGAIQDRTTEHLGPLDRAVVMGRQILIKAIRDLQQGREPANVVRDPERNHFPIAPFVVHAPKGTDWRAYCHYVEQVAGPTGAWAETAREDEGAGALR